ncbi:MAG: Crp/Fnr family transcriptional regulator [Bacteroidota bacterium]
MERLIEHINSIAPISEDCFPFIADKVVERHYAKKDHLVHPDDFAREVYFILEGCVRTYIPDYNGLEHNISFAMEDWWCGDLQSFIRNTTAAVGVQAIEDTAVLAINQKNWQLLHSEIPEFLSYTRILFRNTMFSHEKRILRAISLTAADRYEKFLTEYPALAQRIAQKHIAGYLGITPEFLSMLRSKRKR